METKTPQEIAAEIGASSIGLLGTQDWHSPLHPELVVSELHYSDGTPVTAFRVKNTKTGEVVSSLPSENSPGDVVAIYAGMLAAHQKIELEIKPAILAAIPDLDPEAQIVRGLTVGGKEMIADLVNGQISNLREPAGDPKFSIDKDGAVQVDLSALKGADKLAAQDAIALVAGVSVAAEVAAIDGG